MGDTVTHCHAYKGNGERCDNRSTTVKRIDLHIFMKNTHVGRVFKEGEMWELRNDIGTWKPVCRKHFNLHCKQDWVNLV